MRYYTQRCTTCKKNIGRFEEKFLNSMQVAKCASCHGVLEIKELVGCG